MLLGFLCFFATNYITYDVDEIGIGKIASTGTYQDKCVFTYAADAPPRIEIALFDFATEKIKLVRDGRIRTMYPAVIPKTNGFALVNLMTPGGQISHIDRDGGFVTSERLNELKGWDPDLFLFYAAPAGPGKAYVTLMQRHPKTLALGLMDLQQKSVTILSTTHPQDNHYRYYAVADDQLFLVTAQTGRIDLLNDQYQIAKTLRRPEEVVPVNRKEKWAGAAGRVLSILEQPMHHQGMFSMMWLQHPDRIGKADKKSRPVSLEVTKAGMTEQPFWRLGRYKQKSLVYVWETRDLAVIQD